MINRLLIMTIILSCSSFPIRAIAGDDDEIKKLIGGAAAAIIINGINNSIEGCEDKIESVAMPGDYDNYVEEPDKFEVDRIIGELEYNKQRNVEIHSRNIENLGDCYRQSDSYAYAEQSIQQYDQYLQRWNQRKEEFSLRERNIEKENKTAKLNAEQLSDSLVYRDDAVELKVEKVLIDTKLRETYIRVAMKNISEGKILKPVTVSGVDFKNSFNIAKGRNEVSLVGSPYGISMSDSYNNDYTLTFLTPAINRDQSIAPNKSIKFYTNFEEIPVDKTQYVLLKFDAELTDNKDAEIKIPADVFNKIAAKTCEVTCSMDLLVE